MAKMDAEKRRTDERGFLVAAAALPAIAARRRVGAERK
jgi:hypothetical protein